MNQKSPIPESLALIAGKGVYPQLLIESARKQGVKRIFVIAFRGETGKSIERYAAETKWIYIGQLARMIEELKKSGARYAIMAGQITPTSLFRVRMDAPMISLLKNLKTRNAETIFDAIGRELENIGIKLLPASSFMESHMPAAGLLSNRTPSESETTDIEIGLKVAKVTSGLDIGQTVVIKEGTIIAIEAFEGTDETILRAGKLAGPGIVVVKVAKQGHDMRFDIPVIGLHTVKLLKKVKASALAMEAKRSILLERDEIIRRANDINLCITSVETEKNEK